MRKSASSSLARLTRMGAREDRRGRLSPKLLDCESRVVARSQHRLALFDERAHEWTQLVQRWPAPLDVLFEGERELGSLLELAPEQDERAEDESTEERVQVRST